MGSGWDSREAGSTCLFFSESCLCPFNNPFGPCPLKKKSLYPNVPCTFLNYQLGSLVFLIYPLNSHQVSIRGWCRRHKQGLLQFGSSQASALKSQEKQMVPSSSGAIAVLFPLPAPLHSTELLPWLPGMVAKSLHGRVGVGCAATNITMVNQGTPGTGLGGRKPEDASNNTPPPRTE